jgi:endonuclease YncB( thermonuclease family)
MRFPILMLLFVPTLALAQAMGPARVVDGNTLEVGGERFRLAHIDAPDKDQTCEHYGSPWPCGEEAANVLTRTVAGRQVTCKRGPGAAAAAECRVGIESLNLEMLMSGMAVALPEAPAAFAEAEAAARAARRGLWAGRFVRPMEWRQGARLRPTPAAERCRIKGTVAADGQRVYLVPDNPDYAAATVAEGRGERWFCSEMEAIGAGWRLPEQARIRVR